MHSGSYILKILNVFQKFATTYKYIDFSSVVDWPQSDSEPGEPKV